MEIEAAQMAVDGLIGAEAHMMAALTATTTTTIARMTDGDRGEISHIKDAIVWTTIDMATTMDMTESRTTTEQEE